MWVMGALGARWMEEHLKACACVAWAGMGRGRLKNPWTMMTLACVVSQCQAMLGQRGQCDACLFLCCSYVDPNKLLMEPTVDP